MHMQIQARFSVKDAPPGQTGVVGESWRFGVRPAPFDKLMAGFIRKALGFYVAAVNPPADEIRGQLIHLADWLRMIATSVRNEP